MPNKASKRKFARIRARSMYRRLLKADEKNWKITAPIITNNGMKGRVGRYKDDIGDSRPNTGTMAEHEYLRELNLPWKRED